MRQRGGPRARTGAAALAAGALLMVAGAGPALAADDDEVLLRVTATTTEGVVPTGVCADVVEVGRDTQTVLGTACAQAGTTTVEFRAADFTSGRFPSSGEPLLRVRADGPWAQTWDEMTPERGTAYAWLASVYQGSSRSVVLARAATVTGRVLDTDGVTPLATGKVVLTDNDMHALYIADVHDGAWSATVYPGRAYLGVSAHGYLQYLPGVSGLTPAGFGPPPWVDAPAGAVTDAGSYTLVALEDLDRFVVSGQVRDAVTHKPIANACVNAWRAPRLDDVDLNHVWADPSGCPYQAPTTRTDAQGRYRVVLAVGDGWGPPPAVTIIDPTGVHARVEHLYSGSPGQRITTDVDMAQAYALRGRVVDEAGLPVAGACPWSYYPDSRAVEMLWRCTDTDGWWFMGELSEPITAQKRLAMPIYALQTGPVYAPSQPSPAKAARVTLAVGRQVTAPVTVLPRTGGLAGHVRTADGAPAPNVAVVLRAYNPRAHQPGPEVTRAYTAADGSYRFQGLAPSPFVVEASGQSGEWALTWYGSATDPAKATPVTVRADGTATADLVVSPPASLRVNVALTGLPETVTVVKVTALSLSGAPLGYPGLLSPSSVTATPVPVVLRGLPAAPTRVRVEAYDPATKQTRHWWYRAVSGPDKNSLAVNLTAGGTTEVSIAGTW
ncbi:MAG: carboxypeptidase regulatory-like domain-containing protein [Kineosporiaceae bacterium]